MASLFERRLESSLLPLALLLYLAPSQEESEDFQDLLRFLAKDKQLCPKELVETPIHLLV